MNRLLRGVATSLLLLTTLLAQANAGSPADSLVIRFANKTRMVIYAPDKAGIQALSNYDLNKIVREMGMQLDSVPGGQAAISRDGERYLKDTVLVVTKRKDGVTIVIKGSDTTRTADTTYTTYRDYQRSRKSRTQEREGRFGISLGLNGLVQQSALAAYPEDSYALRPFGSRYVAFSVGSLPTIIRGKRAALKLYYGIEVAWNNFMFAEDVIPEKTPTGIVFTDAGRNLRKSKLTVCTIGVPVVPRVTFYNSSGKRVCHIGIGGYANYRLDSYRKIKEADGDKDRRHSNFDLNNFRYGLMAHLGISKTDFFVKYDLNPLFQPGQGPDVRAISFGFGF